MLLWTIQRRAAYEQLIRTGVLRADEIRLFCGKELRFAYDWMAGEMKERVGSPPIGVNYPVWLWYQWDGRRRRPDMRTFRRSCAPTGTRVTLMTVEVPDNAVLLSDFDMWHTVLNDGYLSLTEQEERCPIMMKEKSWERIFDFSLDTNNEWWKISDENRTVQATVWELNSKQLLKAEHFTAG